MSKQGGKQYGGARQLAVEFISGLFFLFAILILVIFTAFIQGKDLLGFEGQEYRVKVRFPKIGTIGVNDKVRVIGNELGKVKEVQLGENYNEVFVVLGLKKDIPLFEDYSIAIRNASVFGGSYVNIDPGDHTKKRLKLDIYQGQPPIDIINETSDLIDGLKQDEQQLRKVLEEGKILDNIQQAAESMKKGADNFNELVANVNKGEGTLGKLIKDPTAYDDTKKMLASMTEASDNLKVLLKDLKDGKGTLGKLMSDEKAYDELVKSIQDLRSVIDEVAKGDGSLSKLLHDKGELYTSINDSFAVAQELAAKMKKGEGTLGKLMNDDTLYVDMKETVREIRAAVEDYREQAPVATFGSMALGAL